MRSEESATQHGIACAALGGNMIRWESENKNMKVLIILKVQINSANKSKVKIISANNYQSENK